MTPAPQPQQEYIITEDKLRQLEMRFIYHNMEKDEPDVFKARSEFMKDVRSHPHPPAPDRRVPYVECNHSYSSCPINWDAHNKVIRTTERNATLDALWKWAQDVRRGQQAIFENGRYVHPRLVKAQLEQLDAVIWKIESLRTPIPPKEQQP